MSFDEYCALCSGSMRAEISIGKRGKRFLQKRRRRLARKIRQNNGEEVSDDSEDDEDGKDAEMKDGCSSNHEKEDNESDGYDSYDEEHSYDPQLVSEDDAQWLDKTACLGFNPDANSPVDKAWEGWGQFDLYGDYQTDEGDELSPEYPRADCYNSSNSNRIPVFPYHKVCKIILGQVLKNYLLRPVYDTDEEGSDDENENSGDESEDGRSESSTHEFKAWWKRMKKEAARIDKDSLYHAISQLNTTGGAPLNVDYGGIEGADHTWESISGEEYAVHSPRLQSKPTMGLHCGFAGNPLVSNLDLYNKVRRDPFSKVPEDIMYMISGYLPGKSVKALMQASWFYNRATCDNIFWKRRFQEDVLPWYWELRSSFEELPVDTTDFRRLYRWIDHVTAPKLGQRNFLPIINRRRIWGVCEEIKQLYAKEFIRKMRADGEEGPMEMESRQMPATMYPTPPGSSGVWTHWVKGFAVGPGVFETFWNRDGALVGIALSMPSKRKLLGQDEDDDLGIVKKCVPIPAGESITGFILHISDVYLSVKEGIEAISELRRKMEYNRQCKEHWDYAPERWPELDEEWSTFHQQVEELEKKRHLENSWKASVRALTVNLESGSSFDLGMPTGSLNKRPLFVQPGTALLGLSATTAVLSATDTHDGIFTSVDNGAITRLALIHSPEDVENDEYVPQALRTLWHPQAVAIPAPKSKYSTPTCPIWAHPNLSMQNYADNEGEYMDAKIPIAFLPHQALVWAKDATELNYLKRISVLRETQHRGVSISENPVIDRVILGFRVEYREGFNEPPRTIGLTSSQVASVTKTASCKDKEATVGSSEWSHFDIDGANGEAILDVVFDTNVIGGGVLIWTTWNRVCTWRKRDGSSWFKPTKWRSYPNKYVSGGLAAAFDPEEGGLVVGMVLQLDGETHGISSVREVTKWPERVYGDV